MTPDQRASMYAQTEEDEELESEVETEEFQASLTKAGGGMVAVQVGEVIATVPTSAYTKALEKKIAGMERELRNTKNANRHLLHTVNRMIQAVNNLQSQLDNKVDKYN